LIVNATERRSAPRHGQAITDALSLIAQASVLLPAVRGPVMTTTGLVMSVANRVSETRCRTCWTDITRPC
jgi:hypothetical protein